jgi:hypothetical protein
MTLIRMVASLIVLLFTMSSMASDYRPEKHHDDMVDLNRDGDLDTVFRRDKNSLTVLGLINNNGLPSFVNVTTPESEVTFDKLEGTSYHRVLVTTVIGKRRIDMRFQSSGRQYVLSDVKISSDRAQLQCVERSDDCKVAKSVTAALIDDESVKWASSMLEESCRDSKAQVIASLAKIRASSERGPVKCFSRISKYEAVSNLLNELLFLPANSGKLSINCSDSKTETVFSRKGTKVNFNNKDMLTDGDRAVYHELLHAAGFTNRQEDIITEIEKCCLENQEQNCKNLGTSNLVAGETVGKKTNLTTGVFGDSSEVFRKSADSQTSKSESLSNLDKIPAAIAAPVVALNVGDPSKRSTAQALAQNTTAVATMTAAAQEVSRRVEPMARRIVSRVADAVIPIRTANAATSEPRAERAEVGKTAPRISAAKKPEKFDQPVQALPVVELRELNIQGSFEIGAEGSSNFESAKLHIVGASSSAAISDSSISGSPILERNEVADSNKSSNSASSKQTSRASVSSGSGGGGSGGIAPSRSQSTNESPNRSIASERPKFVPPSTRAEAMQLLKTMDKSELKGILKRDASAFKAVGPVNLIFDRHPYPVVPKPIGEFDVDAYRVRP